MHTQLLQQLDTMLPRGWRSRLAAHLGISPQAITNRIAAGTLFTQEVVTYLKAAIDAQPDAREAAMATLNAPLPLQQNGTMEERTRERAVAQSRGYASAKKALKAEAADARYKRLYAGLAERYPYTAAMGYSWEYLDSGWDVIHHKKGPEKGASRFDGMPIEVMTDPFFRLILPNLPLGTLWSLDLFRAYSEAQHKRQWEASGGKTPKNPDDDPDFARNHPEFYG